MTKEQKSVGRLIVKQAQLEYDCSEKVGAKYISAIAYASSEASDLPIGEYLLYTHPAPTAEIIEALKLLREAREMADNWPGIAYSADLTARIDALLARK